MNSTPISWRVLIAPPSRLTTGWQSLTTRRDPGLAQNIHGKRRGYPTYPPREAKAGQTRGCRVRHSDPNMKKGTSNKRFSSFVDADFFCLSKDVKFLRTIFLQAKLPSACVIAGAGKARGNYACGALADGAGVCDSGLFSAAGPRCTRVGRMMALCDSDACTPPHQHLLPSSCACKSRRGTAVLCTLLLMILARTSHTGADSTGPPLGGS